MILKAKGEKIRMVGRYYRRNYQVLQLPWDTA